MPHSEINKTKKCPPPPKFIYSGRICRFVQFLTMTYQKKQKQYQVLIVAGGTTEFAEEIFDTTDTTEKLVLGDNNWRVITPLPRQIVRYPKFTTVSMKNKVVIFGKQCILRYTINGEAKSLSKPRNSKRK